MPSEQILSNDALKSGATARRPLRLARWWAAIVAAAAPVLRWFERERNRRALDTLDDHQLRDIGLSRSDIWQECSKPFWRP